MNKKPGIKKTHEEYVSQVKELNPNICVIGKYINSITKTSHLCLLDGHKWDATPRDILSGYGCPLCGKKAISGPPKYINSIWGSEFKEYLSNFLTEEQMKKYMPFSGKYLVAKCPNCGTTKRTTPALLMRRGIKCQMCSDGISYPNKFTRAFISQISGISTLEYEYSPDWLVINGHKCFYDIYFEHKGKKYIVEVDGIIGHGNSDLFLKENDTHTVKHDKVKEFLAEQHGIEVIRIDAKKSDAEYLKQNIMRSKLPHVLCFRESDINWAYCQKFAVSSLAIAAGKLWDDGWLIRDIAKKLGVCSSTAKRYLVTLSKMNACTYSKELARKRVGKYQTGKNGTMSKKTIRLSDLKIYGSAKEAGRDNGLSSDMIYHRCKNHVDFMYYDEWMNIQKSNKKGA